MKNPEISSVEVTDQPTLVFKGTGKVQLAAINVEEGHFVVFGSDEVDPNNPLTHFTSEAEFKAPAKLYARCTAGGTATVRVWNWF